MDKEIALCLSGGGARGAYELGVISVLEENSISVKAISATSIGALIGASIACGKSASDIFEVIKSKEFRSVFSFKPSGGALFKLNKDAKILDKLVDRDSFEDLDAELVVVAYDIAKAEAVYFKDGDNLKDAILASCSIPPVFHPVKYNGLTLMDGGIVNNFPVELLKGYDYPVLGVNLHPKKTKVPNRFLGWIRNNIYTAWQLPNFSKEPLCDIYLSNEKLLECKIFSFRDIDKAYKLGYEDMQKKLEVFG